jgi:alpha-tubulin suppressor-like RCC1 family protein
MSECVGVSEISKGYSVFVAVMTDGTAEIFPQSNSNVPTLTNFTHISCAGGFGNSMCVALMNDNTIVSWTPESNVFNTHPGVTNVVDASCGIKSCVALMSNGNAVVWGGSNGGTVPSLSGVARIGCGYACYAIMVVDSSAKVWGQEQNGGVVPSNVDLSENVVTISCGYYACVARMTDNSIQSWGYASYGGTLPSGLSGKVVVDAVCYSRTCFARMDDDTIQTWGGTIETLTNVADFSCGISTCVARMDDGTGKVWGSKEPESRTQLLPGTLTELADISCGGQACVALKKNGTAYAWGLISRGGDITCGGSSGCTPLPSGVTLDNVADILCNGNSCATLKNDGTAYSWGYSAHAGTESTKVTNVDVPIGSYHNLDWGLDRSTDLCPKCPLGTYQDQPNKESCKDCPPGRSTTVLGSTLEMACLNATQIKQKFLDTRQPALVPAYNIAKGSCV